VDAKSLRTIDARGRHNTIIDAIDEVTPQWLTDVLRRAGVPRRGEVTALTTELMNVGPALAFSCDRHTINFWPRQLWHAQATTGTRLLRWWSVARR